MFDNTPSDRVQFRALGELQAPGACIVCGSGTREEGYVDLGVYIDYHGTVYICYYCVIQVGEVFKMLTPDEIRLVNQQNSDLLTENAALKATVEETDERLAAYARILGSVGTDSTSSDPAISRNSRENLEIPIDGTDSGITEAEESDSGNGRLISVGASEQDNGSGAESSEPIESAEGSGLFKL